MTPLEFIKRIDNEDSLILIMEDLPAMKVMQAWTIYELPEKRGVEFRTVLKKNETVADVLHEMWSAMPVDMEKLTKIAGVPFQVACESFERLKAAQLVYPDCTIPYNAQRFIRNFLTAYRVGLLPRGTKIPTNVPVKISQ